jgi:hypothetical protein
MVMFVCVYSVWQELGLCGVNFQHWKFIVMVSVVGAST